MVMKRAEKHAGFLKDISDWKERERNGNKKRMPNIKTINKTTRKSIDNKSAAAARAKHLAYILQQTDKSTMQQNDMASAACACKDGNHGAPQITVLSEYFCSADIISTPSGKARRAHKKRQNAVFYMIRVDRGGHGGQYKCDTSALCLYCLF